MDQVSFGCLYFCFCIISSPPVHNFAVGYLVQVGLFYVVNDYLVVPTVSVGFMQLENFMVLCSLKISWFVKLYSV